MFTLAISCLTSSNLPWFMDLTFHVLMQYCSLEHQTLLPSPVTSTTGCCFLFGSISSFFLELCLHWSPVACWTPTDLGASFSVLSFCLFILFRGFSRQEYWSGLPFPSSVDHILSELFTMTRLSWVMYRCESWTIKKAERWRIDVFELWYWRRLLRVPWTARRSSQSILKISPVCSLEGLKLKLKLQYFSPLMQRTDSLEKTLMLGKIECRRRRGGQRMRWLDGITESMDTN